MRLVKTTRLYSFNVVKMEKELYKEGKLDKKYDVKKGMSKEEFTQRLNGDLKHGE